MGNYLTYEIDGQNDLAPYISAESLRNAMSDIPDDTDKETAINADIDAAESEVDSYLASRYTIPLTSAPDVVLDASAVLTAEKLYLRGHGPPEALRMRAEGVRQWLRDVAASKASLPGATESPSTEAGAGVVTVESETLELTRSKLGFW